MFLIKGEDTLNQRRRLVRSFESGVLWSVPRRRSYYLHFLPLPSTRFSTGTSSTSTWLSFCLFALAFILLDRAGQDVICSLPAVVRLWFNHFLLWLQGAHHPSYVVAMRFFLKGTRLHLLRRYRGCFLFACWGELGTLNPHAKGKGTTYVLFSSTKDGALDRLPFWVHHCNWNNGLSWLRPPPLRSKFRNRCSSSSISSSWRKF